METQNKNDRLIGVVGMPGSGKTELFKLYKDFIPHDDLGVPDLNQPFHPNWEKVAQQLTEGKAVIFSDIEFCNQDQRDKFAAFIKLPVKWICFENDPWQCAINAVHRFLKNQQRPVIEEILKIERLSKIYKPFGDIRVVFKSPCNHPFI